MAPEVGPKGHQSTENVGRDDAATGFSYLFTQCRPKLISNIAASSLLHHESPEISHKLVSPLITVLIQMSEELAVVASRVFICKVVRP